jgi:hypothetical protein
MIVYQKSPISKVYSRKINQIRKGIQTNYFINDLKEVFEFNKYSLHLKQKWLKYFKNQFKIK